MCNQVAGKYGTGYLVPYFVRGVLINSVCIELHVSLLGESLRAIYLVVSVNYQGNEQ